MRGAAQLFADAYATGRARSSWGPLLAFPAGRQLPAYSPLPLRAVLRGVGALLGRREAAAREVADFLDSRSRTGVWVRTDSGTSALAAALGGSVREGVTPRVALPAYGCFDLATAADTAGADVVLYDVDPETLGPDSVSLDLALGHEPTALVLVHLDGVPVDWPRVTSLLDDREDVLVIEDAAQGSGVVTGGRPAGSLGDVAVLSFGRGKGITGGGGGALLANSERGRRLVREVDRGLRRPPGGWTALPAVLAQWLLARPGLYGFPASLPFLHLGETIYRAPEAASRQSWLSTGLLAVTSRLQSAEVRSRRRHAGWLEGPIASAPGLTPVSTPGASRAGYLRLPVLASGDRRAELISGEGRRLGIMPGYPEPLHRLDGFRERCQNRGAAFPGADRLARELLTLPTHSRLRAADLERLSALIHGGSRRSGGFDRKPVRPGAAG